MAQNPLAAFVAKTAANALSALNLDAGGNLKVSPSGQTYVTAAASTTQPCGTGAAGDVLARVVIVPGTSAAGIVQIKDGSGTAIDIFAGGGTTALADLAPITVELNATSAAGGWSIITNANVTAIAVGKFTA